MVLEVLTESFSVCHLDGPISLPADGLFFLGRTDREWSLVCPSFAVPADCLMHEDDWRAFRIAETLDFSLVGILAGILKVLEQEGISVFVQSTYCTDYVLVRTEKLADALNALEKAGYRIQF